MTCLAPHADSDPRSWSARWAFLSALCAAPLLLFGGSVTTLGAGMAVDGWLVAEGHFLPFFPVEKWFRDMPTFVEHTHRLLGVLVGACALACLVSVFTRAHRRAERASALVALLAVGLQGLLGGLRVLKNDSDLAFLHGACAQAVFAVLCWNAVLLSDEWRRERAAPSATTAEFRALRSASALALGCVYLQVVLGAWYRHGLRPVAVEQSGLRLLLHGVGALLVMASLAALVRRAAALRAEVGTLPDGLERALKRLVVLLLVQLVLGGMAWVAFRPGTIGPAEWALSVAHVLGGALLLANTAILWLWARRLAHPVRRTEPGAGSGNRLILGQAR